MSSNIHVIHANTSDVTNGEPKLPATSRINYGEIAINFAKDHETISLKNDNNEIVKFISENAVQDKIDETEKVVASSLNDIDSKLEEQSSSLQYVEQSLDHKQDTIQDLDSIRSKANSAYQLPQSGIPKNDLNSDVKRELVSIPFGVVDSTSTSTNFTATVDGITELREGVCMYLKNSVVTSASGFTININGLGDKPVYTNMAAATRDSTIFNASYTMLFVYNETRVEGGCWDCYRGYNSDTNTIGYQIRSNSKTLPMIGAMYRYRILFTSADGNHYVAATTSSSSNATATRAVNQTKINPFGEILYYGTTTTVTNGNNPNKAYLWQQYGLSLGYSFNRTGAALTLEFPKAVYVKAAPQSDGSVIMDANTPIVQDLPSTEDGFVYIFLGIAYSATSIELLINHPVYYYSDGAVRLWTAGQTPVNSITENSKSPVTSGAVYSALYENEKVVSSAFNALNTEIEQLKSVIATLQTRIATLENS